MLGSRRWIVPVGTMAVGILCLFGCKEPSLGRELGGGAGVEEGAIRSAMAGYRDWKKVNEKRFAVPNQTAALCAQSCALKGDPHAPKGGPTGTSYMNVFVSDAGVTAMERLQAEAKSLTFPFGTVFVKERYSSPEQAVPDILTLMIKKGFEYNSESGNWQFIVMSGDGKTILEYGRLKNCMSCHAQAKAHDYVIGKYR